MPMMRGSARMMECLLERCVTNIGFVKQPGTETEHRYRLKVDGEYLDTWITFTYDKFGNADFMVSNKDMEILDGMKFLSELKPEAATDV